MATKSKFSVDRIKESVDKYGVAQTNRYEVKIFPPSFSGLELIKDNIEPGAEVLNSSLLAPEMSFRCESVSMPGRGVKTLDYAVGNQPTTRVGYGHMFTELDMTFICSSDLREKVFFEQWQESISNYSDNSSRKNPRYVVEYYDKYAKSMSIDVFSPAADTSSTNKEKKYEDEAAKERGVRKAEKRVYSVFLVNAFPILINSTQLSYASDNELYKLSVSMTYQFWKRTVSANIIDEIVVTGTRRNETIRPSLFGTLRGIFR